MSAIKSQDTKREVFLERLYGNGVYVTEKRQTFLQTRYCNKKYPRVFYPRHQGWQRVS
jgi:hypothetical protein